jgi:hypothetical protein
VTKKAVPKLPKYTLLNIDPALWKAVKERAEFEGRPLRFVLLQLLRVYAENGFQVVETFNGKRKR